MIDAPDAQPEASALPPSAALRVGASREAVGSVAVWINGTRAPDDAPHVSARDRGLTLADGVFETMRLRNGRLFRLDRHLTRLSQALMVLRIPVAPELREWVLTSAREWPEGDGAVRLTVTRGIGAGGLLPPPAVRPTVIVTVSGMPAFPPALHEEGLSAHVVSGRRNERAMTAGLKTLAYTDSVAALLEAQRVGADEALFLDTDDHLSEATASNLFLWTGAMLLTPPVSCGALPGITRATLLELAYGLGLEVSDRAFGLGELLGGAEAFLSSSLRGVVPLVRVNGQPIGAGVPGEVTRRITEAYNALVERECGGGA